MRTKKASKNTYTITEAAKKLGITRAAVHRAVRKKRLDAEWGEIVREVRSKALLITAGSLNSYRVDESRQARGKKT